MPLDDLAPVTLGMSEKKKEKKCVIMTASGTGRVRRGSHQKSPGRTTRVTLRVRSRLKQTGVVSARSPSTWETETGTKMRWEVSEVMDYSVSDTS